MDSITPSAASAAVMAPPVPSHRHMGSVPSSVEGNRASQLEGHPGGGEPFDYEGAVAGDGLGVLVVGGPRPAKGFDNLDSLNVLHDGAVHGCVGLNILIEVFPADLKSQNHADQGEGDRRQGRQRQTPVNARQGNQAYNRQSQVSHPLGNHVGQRRLNVLDLIHHQVLDLPDRVGGHFPQRGVEEPVRHPQPQALQNVIGGVVGQHGGKAEAENFYQIGPQRQAAPGQNALFPKRPGGKGLDQPEYAVVGQKSCRYADNGQNHRASEPLPTRPGVSEQAGKPALFCLLQANHSLQRNMDDTSWYRPYFKEVSDDYLPRIDQTVPFGQQIHLRRYSVGDIPITFRNTMANLLGLSYPTRPAISTTLRFFDVRSSTAA